LGLILFFCAAWFSHGYINHDEHFQVIEFLGVKLGMLKAESLTWEYFTQSRSWFPAALYFGPAKIQMALGIDNPVYLVRTFRILTGILGFSSVLFLYLSCRKTIRNQDHQFFLICMLLFLCIMPSYHVRTSSENLSGSFIVLATSLIYFKDSLKCGFFFAGIFAAVAFHCRYQVGLMIAGQAIWILVNYKFSRRFWQYLTGLSVGLLIGIAIDVWGWGGFYLTSWNYLRIQLFEGKVNTFGTSPWYDYFNLLWKDIPKPFGLLLFAVMTAFWVKFSRSILTWMTLPFVMVHFMIGHKEVRFLIPALYFAPLMTILLLESLNESKVKNFLNLTVVRVAATLLLVLNLAFLIRETFVAKMPAIGFIEEIYERKNEELVWSGENPYFYLPLVMRFYQLPGFINLQDVKSELPKTEQVLFYQRSNFQELERNPCGSNFCVSDCQEVAASPFYLSWHKKFAWLERLDKSHLRILSVCKWHAL